MFRSALRPVFRSVTRPVFGGGAIQPSLSDYALGGVSPSLVADAAAGFYNNGSEQSFATIFPNFARASTATYVDSSGTLQTAASGEPRIGHHVWDGSAWVNEGVLVEAEARTNLALNSFRVSESVGALIGVAEMESDYGPGLDGNNSATLIRGSGNGTSGMVQISINLSLSPETKYTIWFIVEPAGLNTIGLILTGFSGLAYGEAHVNLTTGEKSFSASVYDDVHFKPYDATKYLVGLTFTTPADGSGGLVVRPTDEDRGTVPNDTTDGMIFYFFQVEEGGVPTSMIPTTTSTATRAADDLGGIPAALLPDFTDGFSIELDCKQTFFDENILNEGYFYRRIVGASNIQELNLVTSATLQGQHRLAQFGSGFTTVGLTSALDATTPGLYVSQHLRTRHSSSDINLWHNGTLETAETTNGIADTNSADLEVFPLDTSSLLGTIKSISYWSVPLSDLELQDTAP